MKKPRMVTRTHSASSGSSTPIEYTTSPVGFAIPVVSDLPGAAREYFRDRPVRLYLGEGMDEYVDLSQRKGEDGRWRLYVHGGRRIIIHPQVANAVEIEVEDYARRKKS